MIWTQPKRIGPHENDWYSTKMIWTVQNHFGPIEGQGINIFFLKINKSAVPKGQLISKANFEVFI